MDKTTPDSTKNVITPNGEYKHKIEFIARIGECRFGLPWVFDDSCVVFVNGNKFDAYHREVGNSCDCIFDVPMQLNASVVFLWRDNHEC